MLFREFIKLPYEEQVKFFEEYKQKWLTTRDSQPQVAGTA